MHFRLLATGLVFVSVAVSACNGSSFSFPTQPTTGLEAAPAGRPPAATGCVGSNPESVIGCEREQYDHIEPDEMPDFLGRVARSLNANGIDGAPFGILRKGSGNNCGGYSCDIICSGQGDEQRQWDVLLDGDGAQIPSWGGPHGVPGIRVDVCEVP